MSRGAFALFLLIAILQQHASPSRALGSELPDCGPLSSPRAGSLKPWTVLIYMAAENDLTPFALKDIQEMESARRQDASQRMNVLVQLDAAGDEGLKRLLICPAGAPSRVLETLPEEGAGREAQRLTDFLRWGAREFPSRHLLVVVWGHGEGSRVALNSSTQDGISVAQLRVALDSVREEREGRPVDVYASDACLMQNAEVVAELADSAEYVAGSAQIQTYQGLPYRELLDELGSGDFLGLRKSLRGSASAANEPYLLARMIPLLAAEFAETREDPDFAELYMSSAVNTHEFAYLLSELDWLGSDILAFIEEEPLRSLDLRLAIQRAAAMESGLQDLGVLLGTLDQMVYEELHRSGAPEGPSEATRILRERLRMTRSALNRAVLSFSYGNRYAWFLPRGLSAWVPRDERGYFAHEREFSASTFHRVVPHWRAWLKALFDQPRSFSISFSSDEGSV